MSLPNGMDWLLQPVARGWCKFESLKDGTLDLCDIALINDAIASHDENSRRVQAAMKQGS